VDGSRAERDLGFRPAYTMRETIRSVLGEAPPRSVRSGAEGAQASGTID
jgi:hypothetical protein